MEIIRCPTLSEKPEQLSFFQASESQLSPVKHAERLPDGGGFPKRKCTPSRALSSITKSNS
jgi:hypothetical protein